MSGVPDELAAEPVTLYKAEDVARARENVERHAWARSVLNGYIRRVSRVLEADRQWIESMVPELTPWPTYGQICPQCVGEGCSMGETGVYEWSVDEPDVLTCRYCGARYPHPDFPETGSITAERMGQTFTYYVPPEEAAHPEDDTGKYAYRWASWPIHVSWSGQIRYLKASWIADTILPLAKTYAITNDVQYAQRAAWVLDAFAQRYPNWLYHSYYGTYADMPPGDAADYMGEHDPMGVLPEGAAVTSFPGNTSCTRLQNFWGSGRFHPGAGGEGSFLLDCAVAYDLIRDARYEDGTPVLSEEMDRRIVNDLILAGCSDLENYDAINNKCGPGRALSAACGILFGQPERVRRGLDGIERLLAGSFHFDGLCRESPSYSSMHLGLMRQIPDILRGYSDPPGYEPEDGKRLDNFQPYDELERYRLGLLSMVRMLRPDLTYPVIGDTHYNTGLSSIWAEILADHYGEAYAGLLATTQGAPLSERGGDYALWYRPPDLTANGQTELPLRTEWFPGWHVAVLRNGNPHGQNALYFNGYEYHGHRHHDTLGISLFALGQEMASDRGYIWDDPRNAWTRSTLSHNIVTVDGANQITSNRHSTLEMFASLPGVEVVQASANAYEQCSQYRRTTALIQLPGDTCYAVDIFRVTGGDLHQYGLNADSGEFTLHELASSPVDGTISYLKNLRAAEPDDAWRGTWQLEDGAAMDVWMPSPIDRLIVADAPGWRTYRGTELHAPPITQILAERSGEALDSVFTAAIVPHIDGDTPVRSVREVRPDDGAVAIVVELADRTDWIISALDDEPRSYGQVEMAGRFGLVSFDASGEVRAMHIVDGTRLAAGETELMMPQPRLTLEVTAAAGRSFTLAQPLPHGLNLRGSYAMGGTTGWEIESAAGRTITVRDYPVQPCEELTIPLVASHVSIM